MASKSNQNHPKNPTSYLPATPTFPLHSLIHPLACYHLYPIPVTIISRTGPDFSSMASLSSGAPLMSSSSISTFYPPTVKPNTSTKRCPYQNTLQLRIFGFWAEKKRLKIWNLKVTCFLVHCVCHLYGYLQIKSIIVNQSCIGWLWRTGRVYTVQWAVCRKGVL